MSAEIVRRGDARKLDAWIEAQRRAGADRWELVQLRRGGSAASTVRRWVTAEQAGETFASDVQAAAQLDADDTAPGAASTYALCAAQGEEPLGRYTLRCTGRTRDQHEAGPEEDASIVGLVGQFMRHQEAGMRLRSSLAVEVADSYSGILAAKEKELERCYKRIEGLETKLDALATVRGELADKVAENARQDREQVARHQRLGKLIAAALAFAPMLLRARMGVGKEDPEVLAFIMSLEPEQLPKLAAALTAAQQIALTALLKRYLPPEQEGPGDRDNTNSPN